MANTRSKFSSYWGHGYWGRLEIPLRARYFGSLEDERQEWDELSKEDQYQLAISLNLLSLRKGSRLGYLFWAPIGFFFALLITGLVGLALGIDGFILETQPMLWLFGITYFALGAYFLRD